MAKKPFSSASSSNDLRQFSRDLAGNPKDLFVLFDENPVPTILSEIPSGVIVFVNKRVAALLGKKLEDIVGRNAAELGLLKKPSDLEKLTRLITCQGYVDNVEVEKVYPDGSLGTDIVSMRIVSINGKQYVFTVVQDITVHKQTKEALNKSENRFRKIVEQAPMAMAIVGMDDKIEFINQKAVTVFGYLHEDIPTMGSWWAKAYPDEEYRRESVSDWMGRVGRAVAEGREITGNEYRVTCKDGTVKTMFISGVPVSRKIFVMFDDISERKRAEDELRNAKEIFELFFKVSPDAAVITRATDGLIVNINGRFTEMSGYSLEEAVGKTSIELNLYDNTSDRQRLVEIIKKSGYCDNAEIVFRTKNGGKIIGIMSSRLVTLEGVPHIYSIIRDISDRKRAEDALYKANQQMNLLLSRMTDNVISLDREWRCVYCNDAALASLRKTREEIIGKRMSDFFPGIFASFWINTKKKLKI
jgi:PAS domain S-box-containing protein